jgi:peptidoglycan hydrolase-like protein with peptidoglycan-binding domain
MNTEHTPEDINAATEIEAPAEEVVTQEVVAEVIAEVIAEVVPVRAERSAVVSGADKDEVLLSACVYRNSYARKSLSVHHLQRRLAVLGYHNADADKDGWYGDLTLGAVAEFQADKNLKGAGYMNAETLEAIFAGDPYCTVVL